MIGADKNELKIEAILNLNNSLKQCVDKPTRLNPPAIIDILVTDLHQFYQKPICDDPLEADDDKSGSPSDHFMVVMEPINAISNTKVRDKRTFKFRAYTDKAYDMMDKELDKVDWDQKLMNTEGDHVSIFHKTLFDVFNQCFPIKSKTVFTEKEPFFTDKLDKLRRRKSREYNKRRKSEKYLALSRIYKKELSLAKKKYYRKKIGKLRSLNPKQWFRWVKNMINDDEEDNFIEVENIKHLSNKEQAERIADKFAEVSK